MRTFFEEKMNMVTTSWKASHSQAPSFGHVIGIALSTISIVLILVTLLQLISAAAIIGATVIIHSMNKKGKPKYTAAAC